RKRGIAPSMIEKQLAASRSKRFEVGVDRIQVASEFLVGKLAVFVEVESFEVPVRIVIDHIFESLSGEKELRSACGRRTSDPATPATGSRFAAGHKAGD